MAVDMKQKPPVEQSITVTEDELFGERRPLPTKQVIVPGRAKPFLVGGLTPREMDEINHIQGQPDGHGQEKGRKLWDEKVVAWGLRKPDGSRMFRKLEDRLAKSEEIADSFTKMQVRTLRDAILDCSGFGEGAVEAAKKGSSPTPDDSTSAPSPSSTSTASPTS